MTMVTTSFRDEDEVLEIASSLWNEGPFNDKSDFYRFARDFALSEIFEEYEPDYDKFNERIEELDNIDESEEIIARASEPYFEAFDYATSVARTLENNEVSPEDRIEKALDKTYRFLQDEFPGTYAAEDLS